MLVPPGININNEQRHAQLSVVGRLSRDRGRIELWLHRLLPVKIGHDRE